MIYFITYGIYILASIFITFIVGSKLHRDGGVWLLSIVEEISFSSYVNNLLLMGYYLINLGLILYAFTWWGDLGSWREAFEKLINRLSVILTLLGYLHFQNIILLYIFFKFKLKTKWKL